MDIIKLEDSIKNVINILEKQYGTKLNDGILELIYKRYKNALICLNSGDLNSIRILGGVRAYLDSYNDYTCPLVLAMDKSETIYDFIIKKDR